MQRYQRYLQKLTQQPPQVTARQIQRRLHTKAKQSWQRQRAQRLPTQLSDSAFRRALVPNLAHNDLFLTRLKTRTTPRFFFAANNRREIVALLRTHAPEQEALIIAAADQTCAHIFDLLGSGPIPLGTTIDWHVDFKSGHRWDPRQYFADIRSAPAPGGYDLKVPWELSRCQHFPWLGQAYWLTDNERYVAEFVAQVSDWIAANPPLLGVNWGCAMDVAIRAVNWLWGYYFFQHSPALTDDFLLQFFKSLLSHGRHIMANLEWSETLTSNHYLSDVVGLVYLGLLLPEFKEAATWRDYGLQALEAEMRKQVYADGVDFEASTSYHRLALELFLSPTLLAQRNGHQFSAAYCDRLERMFDVVQALTYLNGRVPLIGDNDNGRLHRLKVWAEADREWSDYRDGLAIGAVLFDRPDLAHAAGDEWAEAIWLYGATAATYRQKTQSAATPAYQCGSRAFPSGGLYMLAHNDRQMVVDAGSHGQKGNGGHAHQDTLSVTLSALGHPWLVDPGAYLYTADFAERNRFRSTAYHNTVQVDGAEITPMDPQALFRLSQDLQPTVQQWVDHEEYTLLVAEHAGYARLPQPVRHRRSCWLDKISGIWLIRDDLAGTGTHQLTWHWHFAAAVDVTTTVPQSHASVADIPVMAWASRHNGTALALIPLGDAAISASVARGWVSPGYGLREQASIVTWQQQCALPYQITIAFVPIAAQKTLDVDLLSQTSIRWRRLLNSISDSPDAGPAAVHGQDTAHSSHSAQWSQVALQGHQ